MRPYRREKLSSLIRQELDKIIARELEFDSALVTLTDVELRGDLETAVVWVSVIPSSKADEVLGVLSKSQRYLQHSLLKKLQMKRVPKVSFKTDYGPEKAAVVEKKLASADFKS